MRTHITQVDVIGFPVEPAFNVSFTENSHWKFLKVISLHGRSLFVIYPTELPITVKEDVQCEIPSSNDYIFTIHSSSHNNYHLKQLEMRYKSSQTEKNGNFLVHITIFGYYDKETETFVPKSHYNQHLMRSLRNMIQDAMFSFRQVVREEQQPIQEPKEKEIAPPPGFESKKPVVVLESDDKGFKPIESAPPEQIAKAVAQEIMRKKRNRSPKRKTPSPKPISTNYS